MDRNISSFTVLFQPPFWVGIAERWEADGYRAARVVFGAQPTDAQLLQWLQLHWHELKFSPAEQEERPQVLPRSPKRLQREAQAATQNAGMGTKAQQALSRQREQEKTARQDRHRQARCQAAEQKFLLRQQKKREKRRGR